uniref:Reverse transcriptase domain-containing protein n=1 Tax=Latimeria chalumnae TaxID=7897 RepID=H3AYY4_LATCH
MSPLLFALALEPLAIKVLTEDGAAGIHFKGGPQKMRLYANNTLLTLTQSESIPVFMRIIVSYGVLGGFFVRAHRCESWAIIQVIHQKRMLLALFFTFKKKKHYLKYLGIRLSSSFKELFKENGPTILKEIKEDLDRRHNLGCIDTIKMNILFRLLYVVTSVPVGFPSQWFQQVRTAFIKFIWRDKKPHIAKRGEGGLAVPNLYYYYLS